MKIALYQPDIPQNTGTIMRLAACMEIQLDIIGPTGFDMSDRALKRAGLDYMQYTKLNKHISFEEFYKTIKEERLLLLSTHSTTIYTEFTYQENDILLLGRESSGVPENIHKISDHRLQIPIRKELRSLNIAIAASMVLGEALRQTKSFPINH